MATNDDIRVRITADDSQFSATMSNLTKKAQTASAKIGPLGTAVSGLGFALGSVTGQAGQAVSAVAGLANVAAGTGLLGLAISGVAIILAKFIETIQIVKKETDAAKKAVIELSRDALAQVAKDAADAERELKNYGKTAREIAIGDARDRKTFLEGKLRTLNAMRAEAEAEANLNWAVEKRIGSREDLEKRDLSYIVHERELTKEEKELDQALRKTASAYIKVNKTVADRIKLNKLDKETKDDDDDDDDDAKEKAAKAKAERELAEQIDAAMRKRQDKARKAEQELAEDIDRAMRRRAEEEEAKQKAWEKEVEQKRILAAIDEEEHDKKMARLYQLGQTTDFWADKEKEAIRLVTGELAQGIGDYGRLRGEMQAALMAGDTQRYAELERQEADHWRFVLASIAESLSAKAIGEGAILVGKGIGEAALGNPGGAGAIAAGLGLIAAGVAGNFGAGILTGGARTPPEAPDIDTETTARAGSVQGPGRVEETGPQIINYYFGGPVFGQADDAARAVAAFNARGLALAGRRG